MLGKMIPRWGVLLLLVLAASGEDAPAGLVSKDTEQDLVAEATNSGIQALKREAPLSNSYGEPLPSDAYGPPRDIPNIIPDLPGLPAPIYGVPAAPVFAQEPPPGAYGPPSPVVFPSNSYEGPPPPIGKPKPIYGPPKATYGPPKLTYGPPKPVYGPPKKTYVPPKQNLPKPVYGVPFKPPKLTLPKPVYGVPKPVYGPPKPVYGPPKPTYGAPLPNLPVLPAIPELSAVSLPSVSSVSSSFGIDTSDDGLPAPIYGTPHPSLSINLPSETYGPPGHIPGPIGPGDPLVHGIHFGPPQPDANPRPPRPGIPAPPTPPRVLYDGWKPIPGHSRPVIEHQHVDISPPPVQDIHINLDGNSLPNVDSQVVFSGAQINTGYSNVHHDALADIDLNAIVGVGGDSNHIDQSKTVFEAHYTEHPKPQPQVSFVQALPSLNLVAEKPLDTYGLPPIESLSGGPYPHSQRHQGAKGLVPPSGIYGVPPGGQYGVPPRHPHLPIPHGSLSGGAPGPRGPSPRHPIKFREPVPEGLLTHIGHTTHQKDVLSLNHIQQGPTYLPPPIRDIKDTNQFSGNHGVQISIEPSSLYSLPHSGSPINFHPLQQQPSNLYGSPIDSYSVPLLTVGHDHDHAVSSSDTNSITATLDGTVLSNLSNLEAAAILKHCPYHEAILKAAKLGEKIPSDLASSYVASLSSLGSTLSKNSQTVNQPIDLATASHTRVETVVPSNDIQNEKTEKASVQKGKSIKDDSGKHGFKDERLQYVSQQIQKTSEKIKNLSEETKQLQQKIVTANQNLRQVNGQLTQYANSPFNGKHGSYSVQIQSADDGIRGKPGAPSIPHEQLLSEGLLQSILQAIEQPEISQPPPQIQVQNQKVNFQSSMGLADNAGLILPEGYEPIDRTKEKIIVKPKIPDQETQSSIRHTHEHRDDIPQSELSECDKKADNRITHTIVIPPTTIGNEAVPDVENDVAIYFGNTEEKAKEETVTEISVATSISENIEKPKPSKKEYGAKIVKS